MERLVAFGEFVARLRSSSLDFTVKYSSDPQEYCGLSVGEGFRDGLRDPGFGSGPIAFGEVEWLRVHSVPRHNSPLAGYQEAYVAFVSAVKPLLSVTVRTDSVTFSNVGA